jgi:glycogen(starch) synthase
MPPRVLMLGWEFPPFITGGLGTACHGLTKALDQLGVTTTFVLPKETPIDACSSHVKLVSPGADAPLPDAPKSATVAPTEAAVQVVNQPVDTTDDNHDDNDVAQPQVQETYELRELRKQHPEAQLLGDPVGHPSAYANPYDTAPPAIQQLLEAGDLTVEWLRVLVESGELGPWLNGRSHPTSEADRVNNALLTVLPEAGASKRDRGDQMEERATDAADYDGDLIGQAERYARFCSSIAPTIDFDVIHAHDWLTYPAGLAVSRLSGKPLVVHVHSTEFDRSGEHVNQTVYNIERRGMHGAMKVIAVSHLTKGIIVNRYGIAPEKVEVVWNGIDLTPGMNTAARIESRDKIVLYFGRITLQKGPEFFIAAAKRVLEVMPDVKFVVAGSGDLAERMIRMAAEMGIGHKVLFTGFLRGSDIDRVFSIADLYVMPSVSEPFGIAPLEAMSHDVPVLISRNSGVSEVLVHALKCDFWDVDEMANKIVAVLRHAPLSRALRDGGRFELRRITWKGAAEKCVHVYEELADAVTMV